MSRYIVLLSARPGTLCFCLHVQVQCAFVCMSRYNVLGLHVQVQCARSARPGTMCFCLHVQVQCARSARTGTMC